MNILVKTIFVISIIVISSCKGNGTSTGGLNPSELKADTVDNQMILDSIFGSSKKTYNNIISANNILKGRVRLVRIDHPEGHDIFSFPLKSIEFDKEGRLIHWSQVWGSVSMDNIKIDNRTNSVAISNIVDLDTHEYEKHSARLHTDNNQIIFEFEDNFGSFPSKYKYVFEYDNTGKLYKIKKHTTMIDDYEGMDELVEYDNDYAVLINKMDECGNWISITLKSLDETITYNRELFYYPDENPVALSIETDNKLFFRVHTEYDNVFIRYYDKLSNTVVPLLPQDYEEEIFGYTDYRINGNNLYLIYATGNSGAMADNCVEAVYKYDVHNNNWEEIGYCAEGCVFVGNKIKMPIYDDESGKMTYKFYEMK